MFSILLVTIILSYILCSSNIYNKYLKSSLLKQTETDVDKCTSKTDYQTWAEPSTLSPYAMDTTTGNVYSLFDTSKLVVIATTGSTVSTDLVITSFLIYGKPSITHPETYTSPEVMKVTADPFYKLSAAGIITDYYGFSWSSSSTPVDINVVLKGSVSPYSYQSTCTNAVYVAADVTSIIGQIPASINDYAVSKVPISDRDNAVTIATLLGKRINKINSPGYTSYLLVNTHIYSITYDGVSKYTVMQGTTSAVTTPYHSIYELTQPTVIQTLVITCIAPININSEDIDAVPRTCTAADPTSTGNFDNFNFVVKKNTATGSDPDNSAIYLYIKEVADSDTTIVIPDFIADYGVVTALLDEGWNDLINDITTTSTAEPTTEETTTAEPTTEETTTEETTTEEPTTEEPTTAEPTTEEPTTAEPTTEETAETDETGDTNITDQTPGTFTTKFDSSSLLMVNFIIYSLILTFLFF